MTTPAEVLAALLASDAARPRLTCYDDTPGPAQGERVELSARVLANWVAKAGNLLQDDLDAAPGTRVGLDLPLHWRAFYWALATWSVGATLVVGPGATDADVLVTDDPPTAAAESGSRLVVLVSLPMLSRGNPATPEGAIDEARQLATYPDRFEPWEEPSPDAAALVTAGTTTSYEDVVVDRGWPQDARVLLREPLGSALVSCLSAWAVGGSVVVSRGPAVDLAARLESERVTLVAAGDADPV